MVVNLHFPPTVGARDREHERCRTASAHKLNQLVLRFLLIVGHLSPSIRTSAACHHSGGTWVNPRPSLANADNHF
jgi:hypothetical protein